MIQLCNVCLKPTKGSEYHSKCALKLFGTKEAPKFTLDESKLHTAALAMVGKTSLSGIQKKLSLSLSTDRQTLQVASSGGRYILKPQTDRHQFLAQNEHLCMVLASNAQLNVATCGLITLHDGQTAFITKRFDRSSDGRKFRQEDFCQLSKSRPAEKYQGSAELCARLIRAYASEPGIEMLKLFEQLLFSWWIGNGDLHLKNLSLIIGDDGLVKLTPAYDMLCTRLVIPNDELAMPICGRDRKIKRTTWMKFANYCQISKRAADRVIDSLIKRKDASILLVLSSSLPLDMKDQFSELLDQRTHLLGG